MLSGIVPFQGSLLISSSCSPLGWCKCLLSCIIARMTEIITVRSKITVFGDKGKCLGFLHCFSVRPCQSYAGTREQPFKAQLPAQSRRVLENCCETSNAFLGLEFWYWFYLQISLSSGTKRCAEVWPCDGSCPKHAIVPALPGTDQLLSPTPS